MTLFADLALARRLERTEGRGSAELVDAKARALPECSSCWQEFAGAVALYDGASSAITQTFGLGMSQPVTAADLDAIEAFFTQRGAPTYHEVSPLADPTALALLTARHHEPFEFTSLLYRPLSPDIRLAGSRNEK